MFPDLESTQPPVIRVESGFHRGKRELLDDIGFRVPMERTGNIAAGHTRWKAFKAQSVNRRIFGALLTVGFTGLAVKLVSTFKEIIIAYQFGIGDGVDALLIAYLVPSFAMMVIGGSFNAALIPTYIQVREQEGRHAAQRLLSNVMVWSSALLVTISVLLGLASSHILPLLGSGFSTDKITLTRTLFLILLPGLPLAGLATILAAVLSAEERFAVAAMTPAVTPVAVTIAVIWMGPASGVYAIAAAIIIGAALECAVLAFSLYRQGISVAPRWHGTSEALSQVLKQYAPMVAGSFMMSSTVLVDQSMAAMLGPGRVSILNYGNRTTSVAVGIGSVALSTALLPQFARMAAAADWRGILNTVKVWSCLILGVSIPLTAVLMLLSQPLISLLFERGAFSGEDVLEVASVQTLYLLQVPFYLLGMIFVPLLAALKSTRILMWGTVLSLLLNVLLNILFMRRFGVAGIALSTSVVYLIGFVYKAFMAYRVLGSLTRQNGLAHD